ncbi:hypothetical protein CDIK_0191 [Cucumispora dikerogammari]|nr:hypothetical protein CDIK_0191 [Cucumispora dikerogammari]
MLISFIGNLRADLSDFNIKVIDVSDKPSTSSAFKKTGGFDFMKTKNNSTASLIRGLSLIKKQKKEREEQQLKLTSNKKSFNASNLIDSVSDTQEKIDLANSFAVSKKKQSAASTKAAKGKQSLKMTKKNTEKDIKSSGIKAKTTNDKLKSSAKKSTSKKKPSNPTISEIEKNKSKQKSKKSS